MYVCREGGRCECTYVGRGREVYVGMYTYVRIWGRSVGVCEKGGGECGCM